MGCPIRKFTDQSVFSAPRDLSQSITSFIASYRQGIHQTPFSRLIRSRRRKIVLCRSKYTQCFVRRSRSRKPYEAVSVLDLDHMPLLVGRAVQARPNDICSHLSSRCHRDLVKGHNEYLDERLSVGGAYRDRTDDPLLAKQMLSQLS